MAARLFHVAVPGDWAAAQSSGEYEWSTRGARFADVGFVHLAYEHQVSGVIERYYRDLDEVVLLELDPDRVGGEIRVEAAAPGGDEFPHSYGPLPPAAVIAATSMRREA
jgi:uncharacterized protein (DUF952 family)